MSKLRTFIAIEVSPDVRARVGDLAKRLRASGAKASWTRPENLHLTLKFLGETDDRRLPDVCRAVERAAADREPFVVSFRHAGAFPRDADPRTVWIGADRGQRELCLLQDEIERQLAEEGFPRERRKFVPHLTVGRVRAGGPAQRALGQLILEHAGFEAGEVIVDEVLALASFLEPQGPTYQVLSRVALDG